MKATAYEQDLNVLRGVIKRQSLVIIGMVVLLMLGLFALLKSIGNEKTVITPPTLKRSFWVQGSDVSDSYLEEMGEWVAYLALEVSPSNVDYKTRLLLQYAAPESHAELDEKMKQEAARLKRDAVATNYDVYEIVPYPGIKAALLKGRYRVYVSDKLISTENRLYFARFRLSGSRMQLQSFERTTDADLPKLLASN